MGEWEMNPKELLYNLRKYFNSTSSVFRIVSIDSISTLIPKR